MSYVTESGVGKLGSPLVKRLGNWTKHQTITGSKVCLHVVHVVWEVKKTASVK